MKDKIGYTLGDLGCCCTGQCRAYKKEAVVKVDGILTIKQSQEELFEELSK